MTVSRQFVVALLAACLAGSCLGFASGPYLGQEPPGLTPEVFAPGIISLPGRFERTPNFYPGGREFYFTIIQPDYSRQDIYYCTCDETDQWSAPREIFFSADRTSAADVSLTADGQVLCFSSNLGKSDFWDNDIWISERVDGWWSEPTKLSAGINTNAGEWGPCLLNNGTVYFGRSITTSDSDIFRSRFVDGAYETARAVPGIGSNVNEWDAFVAEDESYMIFKSNRAGGYGSLDLYVSFQDEEGDWSEPLNLGPVVNSAVHDDCGNITPEGKYFMFARRDGNVEMDIYWVDVRAILPDPNGPIRNLSTGQRFGSIQCAVNYAGTGETLEIMPGCYHEPLLLDKDIRMQTQDPGDPLSVGGTILQGPADQPVITLQGTSAACEIAGLTIRGGSVGIAGIATDAAIRNCRIMDNVTHGVELSRGSNPHLYQCLVTGNGQAGVMMTPTVGGRLTIHCAPVIEDCIIVDNGQSTTEGGEPVFVDSIVD